MRSPNRSRSRKNNNGRKSHIGNVINRVFDSSGPGGRVRGTPAQLIEKYQTSSRDAILAGDRISAENFTQHAEHYIRILAEALEEQAARQGERDSYIDDEPKAFSPQEMSPTPEGESYETRPESQRESSEHRVQGARKRRPYPPRVQNKDTELDSSTIGFDTNTTPNFLKPL